MYADRNWIHTADRVDIQRLDTGENLITERGSEISPGVFVHLVGNDLFVRDRRERSPGIRVRSSSGTVESCAYLHQRAQDLGLFNGTNLIRNPSFRLASRSNQLADDWSVAGPVEAMTVSGGQAMSALAGGKLWQRIQVRPKTRYLMYARKRDARFRELDYRRFGTRAEIRGDNRTRTNQRSCVRYRRESERVARHQL